MEQKNINNKEFIVLMAMLMSLLALAIDSMLPALSLIGKSLNVKNPNDNQLVLSTIFIGMSMGLMIYGPISDSYGRKKAIYLGMSIFSIGCLISLFSNNFTFMLLGRVLQGFGGSSCRVISVAMIRDKFEGPEMGKVMSLIMVFFIMVPALAPSIGQGILFVSEWRSIFLFIMIFGLLITFWLYSRQNETHLPEKRQKFSFKVIFDGISETLKNSISRNYILAAGIIFGSFVGYLSSAQQILQIQYNLGESFSLYFGGLALAIGSSAFFNSKLVMKFPMEKLCLTSLIIISFSSTVFIIYSQLNFGNPPLLTLMIFLGVTFFSFGILFGNLNTLAIQPLGHIAGTANSVISSIQTFISVIIGGIIGRYYNGTVIPLVSGFLICSTLTLIILLLLKRKNDKINLVHKSI